MRSLGCCWTMVQDAYSGIYCAVYSAPEYKLNLTFVEDLVTWVELSYYVSYLELGRFVPCHQKHSTGLAPDRQGGG